MREELFDWTDRFIRAARLIETPEEKRLRHAACLMADIGWRAHPDYRGEQSLNLIANGNFGAITHEGRAFLGLHGLLPLRRTRRRRLLAASWPS